MDNAARGESLVRIYRQIQTREHDLNPIRGLVDVYGADVPAIVKPMQSEVIELVPGAHVARRLELWIESEYDLDVGYLVDVKRTRIGDGVREVVSAELAEATEVGDTTLAVDTVVGFRSGDAVLLWDGDDAWEESRVRSVATGVITLYEDCAVQAVYDEGSAVVASRMYRVEDQRIPEDVGPYRVALLQHVARALAVA